MFPSFLYVFSCVNLFLIAETSIPKEVLCANPECTEPISEAQGLVTYASSSRNVLNFKPGHKFTIISKSKSKSDYWGAVINGRSGYVPSNLIKEIRVFYKFEDLIPISIETFTEKTSVDLKNNSVENLQNINVTHSENTLEESKQKGSSLQSIDINQVSKKISDPSESITITEEEQKSELELPLENPNVRLDDSFTKNYNIVEGTAVYAEEISEITPSATFKAQKSSHTIAPTGTNKIEIKQQFEEQKSLIAADITNLESNENETLSSQNNYITESEKDLKEEKMESEKQIEKNIVNQKKNDEESTSENINEIFSGSTSPLKTDTNFQEINKNKNTIVNEKMVVENILKNSEIQSGNSNTVINELEENKEEKIFSQTISHPSENIVTSSNEINMPNSNVMFAKAVNNENEFSPKINKYDSSPTPPNEEMNLNQQSTKSQPLATEIAKKHNPENYLKKNSDPVQITIKEEEIEVQSNEINNEKVDLKFHEEFENTLQVENLEAEKIEFNLPKESNSFEKSQPDFSSENITDEVKESTSKSEEHASVFEGSQGDLKELPDLPDTASLLAEEVMEVVNEEHETLNIFSQAFRFFSNWFGKIEEATNKKILMDPVGVENSLDDLNEKAEIPESDEYGIHNEVHWIFSTIKFFLLPLNIFGSSGASTYNNTYFYLIVTAVTVLFFTLGHNFIEKKGKTGPLIAKINKLEQELLIASKENFILKDEIQNIKDKITLYENAANDELVLTLQAELEESKKARSELESSNEILQQELDAATEAGLDLNKMLSEVLTQKGGSESLLESVENLQAQLNSQQKVIDEMTKKLGVKNEENEALQAALDSANEKIERLEEESIEIKQNLNAHFKEKEDITQDLKSQISQLEHIKEKELTKYKNRFEELQKKYSETSKALAVKEEEFKSLKESIKNLKFKGSVNLEDVFDVSRMKGELAILQKENETLRESVNEEENIKQKLEDQVKSMNFEIENLKKNCTEADIKKDEAEKKLDVLSGYFKEKETQLQKELGLQEALWAQKKGDEKAVYNMMKSLQEEVESYKSQNETLKKEILDQERGLKNQIATLEQKAHENWVAARQAERKLEENKQEMAQLRNRLTLIEKNNASMEGKANHRSAEELNGEPTSPVLHDTSSPLMFPPLPLDPASSSLLPPGFMPHPMFIPPPVAGFIPPPPFLPGDRRPPPLGRMSSPPLNNRFSPSSPADYPFERMSSPPLSPLVRNYRTPNEADREHFRHRTPPYPPLHHRNWEDNNDIPGFIPISSQRDSAREPKGSNISSGHSSSDSLEKSSRHSGRV